MHQQAVQLHHAMTRHAGRLMPQLQMIGALSIVRMWFQIAQQIFVNVME